MSVDVGTGFCLTYRYVPFDGRIVTVIYWYKLNQKMGSKRKSEEWGSKLGYLPLPPVSPQFTVHSSLTKIVIRKCFVPVRY